MENTTVHEEIVHVMKQLAQGRIQPLKVVRCAAVKWALAQSNGNVSQAAQMLGISRGMIYRYVRL
jgi:transcriptional regulator of acetoin/glycerol metabolism